MRGIEDSDWERDCVDGVFTATAQTTPLPPPHRRPTRAQYRCRVCRYCAQQWSTLYPETLTAADNIRPLHRAVLPTPHHHSRAELLQWLHARRGLIVSARTVPAAIVAAIIVMSYVLWLGLQASWLPAESRAAHFADSATSGGAPPLVVATLTVPSVQPSRDDLLATVTLKSPTSRARVDVNAAESKTSTTRGGRGATAAPVQARERQIGADTVRQRSSTLRHPQWVVDRNERSVVDERTGAQSHTYRFRVQLKQQGDRVTGRGEKWAENDRAIPSGERTPITVVGRLDGPSLALTFAEPATSGNGAGRSLLMLARDGVLRGSFTSARSRSRGSSIAWRMR